MKFGGKFGILFGGAAFLLVVVFFAWAVFGGGAQDPLVTISHATTRITVPLKPNGYPDYLEALNQEARGNATPTNNAAVILAEIDPPEFSEQAATDEFYRRLGVPQPAQDGPRHQSLYSFVMSLEEKDYPPPTATELAQLAAENAAAGITMPDPDADASRLNAIVRERVDSEIGKLETSPWKESDHPWAARWLKEQEPVFARLAELARRTEYYAPIVATSDAPDGTTYGLIFGAFPHLTISMRDIGISLRIRCMTRLERGDFDGALGGR
ncbi:MAG: hypothetical protein QM811_26900 [Pirellulales bacterium]